MGPGSSGWLPSVRVAWVTSAMRRMKSRAASTMPTETPTTMSKKTVSRKQASSTATSLCGATRRVWRKCLASDMFQATSSSSAASEAMGR